MSTWTWPISTNLSDKPLHLRSPGTISHPISPQLWWLTDYWKTCEKIAVWCGTLDAGYLSLMTVLQQDCHDNWISFGDNERWTMLPDWATSNEALRCWLRIPMVQPSSRQRSWYTRPSSKCQTNWCKPSLIVHNSFTMKEVLLWYALDRDDRSK